MDIEDHHSQLCCITSNKKFIKQKRNTREIAPKGNFYYNQVTSREGEKEKTKGVKR